MAVAPLVEHPDDARMRVLLVEDEPKLAIAIRRVLAAERLAADVADHGLAALSLAAAKTYDVIVLDRLLPDLDGIEVLRLLRTRGIRSPVLMVTAAGTLDSRVSGLEVA